MIIFAGFPERARFETHTSARSDMDFCTFFLGFSPGYGAPAALLTTMLLKVVGLDEYSISVAAVVALMVCWSAAPKLIR